MQFKVFISSVQREFAAERQMLAEYVRKDPLLCKFFEVFRFEEAPACDVEVRDLYLPEVEKSDTYLGILGAQFGNAGWTAMTLLTTHESIPRNKVIAKALDWAGYVERSGHGTEFIIEKCEAQGLSTPQYKPDSALFHTVIWRKTEVGGVMGGVEAQSGTSQGQVEGTSQGQVVSLFERITSILAERELSSGDVTTVLGKEYYSGHLRRVVKMLLSDGIIEYTIPEKPRSRLQKYRLTPKGRQVLAQKGAKAL